MSQPRINKYVMKQIEALEGFTGSIVIDQDSKGMYTVRIKYKGGDLMEKGVDPSAAAEAAVLKAGL